mmetsp:Transcript_13615/g.42984  ORF Transcript_13615/g.42984 Transcript_13615/m.42984 type:complete len:149 (-) Transcript_13615:147-593(-)
MAMVLLRGSRCGARRLVQPAACMVTTRRWESSKSSASPSSSTSSAAAASTPSESSTKTKSSEDRLHSTDIAFKPTEDGWGYSPQYSENWDRIFGGNTAAKGKSPQATENKPVSIDPRDLLVMRRILKNHGLDPQLTALLDEFGFAKVS